MAMNYKTPGVYVVEESIFPPSVAEVATAIPAFVGYTEKSGGEVARITSLLEFTNKFGKAAPITFSYDADKQEAKPSTEDLTNGAPKYMLYYCLQIYFSTGEGRAMWYQQGHTQRVNRPKRAISVTMVLAGRWQSSKGR